MVDGHGLVTGASRRVQRLAARDGWKCAYCKCTLGYAPGLPRPTIDHVHPRSRGGSDRLDNLVLACDPCNTRKGDRYTSVIPGQGPVMFERSCRHQSAAAFCLNCAGR